jgi:hypothetical protein
MRKAGRHALTEAVCDGTITGGIRCPRAAAETMVASRRETISRQHQADKLAALHENSPIAMLQPSTLRPDGERERAKNRPQML